MPIEHKFVILAAKTPIELCCATSTSLFFLYLAYLSFISLRNYHYRNKDTTQANQQVSTPVPAVTDMDSDGIGEVVMVTKDGRLKTMRVPVTDGDETNQLPELSVVNETQLPLEMDEDGLMSYPVAIETGFISEYLSMVQVRKQVMEESIFYRQVWPKLKVDSDWHMFYYFAFFLKHIITRHSWTSH